MGFKSDIEIAQECAFVKGKQTKKTDFVDYLPKNSFKSSSTVPIPAMPNVSVRIFATFGERNAGRVGPRWIFFTPSANSASSTITAFCSYHAML